MAETKSGFKPYTDNALCSKVGGGNAAESKTRRHTEPRHCLYYSSAAEALRLLCAPCTQLCTQLGRVVRSGGFFRKAIMTNPSTSGSTETILHRQPTQQMRLSRCAQPAQKLSGGRAASVQEEHGHVGIPVVRNPGACSSTCGGAPRGSELSKMRSGLRRRAGGGRLLRSGRPRSPEDGGELSEDLPGGCEDHRPGRRAADREDSLDRRDRAFWGGEGGQRRAGSVLSALDRSLVRWLSALAQCDAAEKSDCTYN